jgi:hypothetical protein
VALRRGDQDAEWLRLEQARLDFQRAKHQKTPMKADRESYSPVGRGSCRAGGSQAKRLGGSLALPDARLAIPTAYEISRLKALRLKCGHRTEALAPHDA